MLSRVRDEVEDVRKWWVTARPSPEVEHRLAEMALVRAQVFLPILIIMIAVALVISEPAGIPVTLPILVLNLSVLSIAVGVFVGLRRPSCSSTWPCRE